MMKHLISWVVSIFGPTVIDTQCKAIPPNHKILLFTKGITMLSQVLGHKHKKMCSILLGLIVDLPVPGGMDLSCMVKATCVLLDFLFLAQFWSHICDTIHQLEECLVTFHNNKVIFVDLGIREYFNIPKLHSLLHYASSIRMFSTTDNYNTEQTEQLHINLAKDTYHVTNHKGEFAQMTTWLEHCEKVQQHLTIINWRLNDQRNIWSQTSIEPLCTPSQLIKVAQSPSKKAVSLYDISWLYGALQFKDALANFIAMVNHPGISGRALHVHAADTLFLLQSVPVYHNIKFTSSKG
jgi:hypothetical protein